MSAPITDRELAAITALAKRANEARPDYRQGLHVESALVELADLRAKVAELGVAMTLGQANCDDVYNDLKHQHNLDKLSWGGRLLEHKRQADELRSTVVVLRAELVRKDEALREIANSIGFSGELYRNTFAIRVIALNALAALAHGGMGES